MNSSLKFGLAIAAFAGVAGTVDIANADTVSIGFSLTQSGPVTLLASSVTGSTSYVGPIGATGFTSNGTSASGNPPLAFPTLFATNSLDLTSSAGGTVFLWMTESNITAPLNGLQPFVSTFTDQNTSVVAILQTFYDAGNGVFTDVTSLGGPFTFVGNSLPQTATAQANIALTGNPYSVTALYELTVTGTGNVNDTVNISLPVPGPVIGAGLPGLLAACGGLIALARRRRRKVAA